MISTAYEIQMRLAEARARMRPMLDAIHDQVVVPTLQFVLRELGPHANSYDGYARRRAALRRDIEFWQERT